MDYIKPTSMRGAHSIQQRWSRGKRRSNIARTWKTDICLHCSSISIIIFGVYQRPAYCSGAHWEWGLRHGLRKAEYNGFTPPISVWTLWYRIWCIHDASSLWNLCWTVSPPTSRYLCMAPTMMVNTSAIKNTAFAIAPRVSALAQLYVFRLLCLFE